MFNSKEVQKNKVLTYYALAIVLPCIVLGILAFRGIRNDQALVERENQRKFQEIGESISNDLLLYLDSIEQTFQSLDKPVSTSGNVYYFNPEMTSFAKSIPLLKGVFRYSTAHPEMHLPGSQLLYLPDYASLPNAVISSSRITEIIDEGWKYEFRDRNYTKAIAYYSNAVSSVRDDQSKAIIYNIMARIYRKLEQKGNAIEAYRLIADQYKSEYFQGSIPAGITAQREIIKLYLQENNKEKVLSEMSMLISLLEKPVIPFKQAYFQNTLDEINSTVTLLDSIPNELKEIMDGLKVEIERTQYLHHFHSIQGTIGNLIQNQTPRANRSLLRSNGHSYFFAGLQEGGSIWVLLYDPELCYAKFVAPQLDAEAEAIGFDWKLKYVGRDSSSLALSMYPSTFEYTFPQGLPDWKIEFIPQQTGTMLSLFRSGQGIYLYIFILILIILFVGLFFTLYTINQELRLSRMKSFFISTVSHEFKSPITSIRQMAEMLDRGRVASPERKKIYYNTMLRESERLSHLVENILDFARMEEGRKVYRFKRGYLEKTVSGVVETFRVQSEGKGIHLEFKVPDDLPEITFDKEALEQVIHNLLDNASKYSGEGNRIEISLERSQSHVLIHVRDWGMGIPRDEQEKIFNRFYRSGDELTSRVKGSGIGLTVVKQIVEDHQGKVSVKSKPGEGSVFTISLPINSNHA